MINYKALVESGSPPGGWWWGRGGNFLKLRICLCPQYGPNPNIDRETNKQFYLHNLLMLVMKVHECSIAWRCNLAHVSNLHNIEYYRILISNRLSSVHFFCLGGGIVPYKVVILDGLVKNMYMGRSLRQNCTDSRIPCVSSFQIN